MVQVAYCVIQSRQEGVGTFRWIARSEIYGGTNSNFERHASHCNDAWFRSHRDRFGGLRWAVWACLEGLDSMPSPCI